MCVYSIQCTVYSVQFTVYSVQCTVYSVQCTVYSVQCTMYSCTVVHSEVEGSLLSKQSLDSSFFFLIFKLDDQKDDWIVLYKKMKIFRLL